jgi:hypothetical protein
MRSKDAHDHEKSTASRTQHSERVTIVSRDLSDLDKAQLPVFNPWVL